MAARSESASLTEEQAKQLLADFLRTTPNDIYSAKHLPKSPEIDAITRLSPNELSTFIVHAATHVRTVRVQDAEREKTSGSVYAARTKWFTDGGMITSLLIAKLLAKTIPFTDSDLQALVRSAFDEQYAFALYENGLLKALENFASGQGFSVELADLLRTYLQKLRMGHSSTHISTANRLAALIEPQPATSAGTRSISRAEQLLLDRATCSVQPPTVVETLIAHMSVPEEGDDRGAVCFSEAAAVGPILQDLLDSVNHLLSAAPARYDHHDPREPRTMLNSRGVPSALTMLSAAAAMATKPIRYAMESGRAQRYHNGCGNLIAFSRNVLKGETSATPDQILHICHALSRFRPPEYIYVMWGEFADAICTLAAPHAANPSDELLLAVIRFRERLIRSETAGDRASARRIDEVFGIGPDISLLLGEPWSDRAYQDIFALPAKDREHWVQLLRLCSEAKGSTPTGKWIKAVDAIVAKLPSEQIQTTLERWFPLVGRPRPTMPGGKIPGLDSTVPSEPSADTLRGLAFLACRFDTPRMAQALGDLAMACFKMIPGHGARCIKPGSSALWSLARMTTPSALAQLSRLRQLVKFGTAKKMLDNSLDALAAKLGITTEQLHEIAAPDFGLSPDSTIDEEAGDYALQLVVEPAGARIRIIGDDGKERKSVPEAVKKEHGETLKALKQAQADIDKMLEAQRARIDALFIADRTWTVDAWRERYITHPLVGVLGRRLIWNVIDDPKSPEPGRAILYRPETKSFADLDGKPVSPEAKQHIKLWHPIFAAASEVARWREVIESSNLRQPVKQAHREVYPLTDAERRTGSYSNRFAAHIIKQHAFQQLAADRGWKSKLRLMVDDTYPPPMRELPSWALRAEFWIESVGDNFGTDTTESGSYLYLATDQVRFYRIGAAQAYAHAGGGGYETYGVDEAGNHPVPLEQIPPLVFSEIMRDVDLFVGGASVGNNADWQDGGPDGRFREYWQSYSFGALSASGKARREFLERLVPRLKIASQCEFEGDFLIIKGSLRTYKIHLGSGNILMKPNDQYLCIVPNSSFQSNDGPGGVFLPFDGDRTLSIILSKAFMLAEDTKIKDGSIISQIERG